MQHPSLWNNVNKLNMLQLHVNIDHIDGVIVSLPVSSAVDCGFEARSGLPTQR